MPAIHTSNNTLIQAGSEPVFTGIVHDDTLSGNGTNSSPLGCINDFSGVTTDSTISGDGVTQPLGIVGVTSFTGVIRDSNLSGDGYNSELGLNSSIATDEFIAGNTVMTDNLITMHDSYGDTTVTPTKIRLWDSMGTQGSVVTDNTLTGAGSPEQPLGLKNGATLSGNYGTAYISNYDIHLSGQNSAQAKLALTNYGSTPYLELSNSGETATMDIYDINRVKECLTIKHDYDMWGNEFNRTFSALSAHNGATLVDKSAAGDVSPVQSNDIYYPTKYYENDYMIYTTMPIYRNGGADMHYTMYNESGVYDSGSKYLLGAETHTHHTYSMNIRTKNFQQPWAGLTTFGLKDYVNSYTFIMPSNWIFESGWIELKDASGESNYLPCYSGCWYTVGKEYAAESNSNYYTWKLLNSGVNIFLDSNQP